MYKNYLIISSKKDRAGTNITTSLSQFKTPQSNFRFLLVDDEIIFDKNYESQEVKENIAKSDFIIFASKHQSEKKEKSLSIHAPGNPRKNEFGGEEGKLCKSSALFQKHLFEILNEKAKDLDYKITLECTHHGPLIDKPCVFIEIGSTEDEWKDNKAAFAIAKTILEAIETFKFNKYREIGIGIGGPHYCPNFNKIQLNSNVALSHVIPSYALPLTEEMVQEAVNKTEEELDFVVLDWKGMGSSEQRQQALNVLDKLYIRWKKTSDIEKDVEEDKDKIEQN